MSFTKYLIRDYNHRAERKQYEHIADILSKRYQNSEIDCILIGNYSIEGVELDALILTEGNVTILEFKNYGGNIIAVENGPWTSDGRIIPGGAYGKNPFCQARLNRSKAIKGLSFFLKHELGHVRVLVIFSQKAVIHQEGISQEVKKWLSICDDFQLDSFLLSDEQETVISKDSFRKIPDMLNIRRLEMTIGVNKADAASSVFIPDAHTDLFSSLEALPDDLPVRNKYSIIGKVFRRAVEAKLTRLNIKFAGFFPKVDYLIKENRTKINGRLAASVQDLRERIRHLTPGIHISSDQVASDMELKNHLVHDVAALCRFIGILYDTDIPEELKQKYPFVRQNNPEIRELTGDKSIRVVINSWDDRYILATTPHGEEIKICYNDKDGSRPYMNRSYLKDILLRDEQLNLVRPTSRDDIIYPELIIFDPDYLIDVTSLASCFTEDEDHITPYTYFIHKLQPNVNSEAILLGNFAGQLLDEALYGVDSDIDKSWTSFVRKNILSVATTDFSNAFRGNAEIQKIHIRDAIKNLAQETGVYYDPENVILEPTFFFEMLGLQGRMDFLQKSDNRIVIEQKSGRALNNPNDPRPIQSKKHYVQLLLYMAILHYNFGKKYSDMQAFLLYSKYQDSLLVLNVAPELSFKALKLRNQIVWTELLMSRGGSRILESLKPENVCPKQQGLFWERFTKPKLNAILDPIKNASYLEKDYYYRFLTFIINEQILSKIGNRTQEDSGFASAWNESLLERKNAGNIYDRLTIQKPDDKESPITKVIFLFPKDVDNDTSNFREGDIVFFYPYDSKKEPLATEHFVFRGYIQKIDAGSIYVLLRHPQTSPKVFGTNFKYWAIEHDYLESSYTSLYRGMQAFLTAPKTRRDLILLQRKPEVDMAVRLKGDYTNNGNGKFNDLVLKVKQAKDLFLIIGPPGTGKTSYGLMDVLKEQLLEEGSSVLLLSYTNRAVDEMCSKLVKEKIDFIRVGNELNCAESYRQFLISKQLARYNQEEMRKVLESARVFCGTTTALLSNLSLLQMKSFDLAIVDEASQILEPQMVGLLSAQHIFNRGAQKVSEVSIKKFVLIGDEKQLPAVVQQSVEESRVTEPDLLTIHLDNCRSSFFERLLKAYRSDDKDNAYSYMLIRQGRMHRDIALFPNYAFYQNKLIPVPLDFQTEETSAPDNCGHGIVNILKSRRVAFISYPSQKKQTDWEYEVSDKVNRVEAEMIAATVFKVWQLYQNDFNKDMDKKKDKDNVLGIIVPYRNQISTVRKEMEKYPIPSDVLRQITIDTVERYQGSQREIIIYGFTVKKYYQMNFLTSNQYVDARSGAIIDRKLNVAITRAMKHLIMIGNSQILRENIVFYKLIRYVQTRQSFFEVDPELYSKGQFSVPAVCFTDNAEFSHFTCNVDKTFNRAFDKYVIKPIKNDPDTKWPEFILGNVMSMNENIIDYGRIDFSTSRISQLDIKDNESNCKIRVFTPEDQVLLYCFYIMRMHYCSEKSIFTSYYEWFDNKIKSVPAELNFVDVGCGPATCGLAFITCFADDFEHLNYYGLDVSKAMRDKAGQLLTACCGSKVDFKGASSFRELNDSWAARSEIPSLILFNISYFFSNINTVFADYLASELIAVMEKYPLNKYIFVIQNSPRDSNLRSYRTFREKMGQNVRLVRSRSEKFSYQLTSGKTLGFCYEIWER